MNDWTWKQMVGQQLEHLTLEQASNIVSTMRDHYEVMSNEDLHCLFWEAYKSTEGVRPRHVMQDDRDAMLCWFCYELMPWQIAARDEQGMIEDAQWAAEEAEYARQDQIIAEEELVAAELVAAYDTRFDHHDPRI